MVHRKPWLEQLRRTLILEPINADPRSTPSARYGRTPEWIFANAIGGGQADFDQPLEDLSPRERVMLYALFNQKAHIDELIHAFMKFLPTPETFQGATVVDVGCGPFTAGLALANVIGNRAGFRYFGVDRAASMCDFGSDLADAVRAAGEFNERTVVSFHRSLDEIDFGPPRAAQTTLVVLSYLLASTSLDVNVLVGEITSACDRIGLGMAIVLYTNSTTASARAAYPAFEARMQEAGFELYVQEEERFTDSDKPRIIHYALFKRPAVTSIPVTKFLP